MPGSRVYKYCCSSIMFDNRSHGKYSCALALAQAVPHQRLQLAARPQRLGVHELEIHPSARPPPVVPAGDGHRAQTAAAHVRRPLLFPEEQEDGFFFLCSPLRAAFAPPVAVGEKNASCSCSAVVSASAFATPRALPASPPPPNHDMRTFLATRASPPRDPELVGSAGGGPLPRACTLTKTSANDASVSKPPPRPRWSLGTSGKPVSASTTPLRPSNAAPTARTTSGSDMGGPGGAAAREGRFFFCFFSVSPSRRSRAPPPPASRGSPSRAVASGGRARRLRVAQRRGHLRRGSVRAHRSKSAVSTCASAAA